jgi:cellulose synthase/poly-beta-1,6-N-acetylglucosamine synthase-like glycosyltransferase
VEALRHPKTGLAIQIIYTPSGSRHASLRVHFLTRILPTMPAITAVLHTKNDAIRLGRALETLYPCDEILIIDHGSHDTTVDLAREYGARVIGVETNASTTEHLRSISNDWALCLSPRESLTESLAASLFEWKVRWNEQRPRAQAFSVRVREETATGWLAYASPEIRLVPSDWNRWHGEFPVHDESGPIFEGELLRFAFP